MYLNKSSFVDFLVWYLGSSIIKRAFLSARCSEGGVYFGLQNVEIWWQGYGGLLLVDVRKKIKIKTLCQVNTKPFFIILQCGGNDLGKLGLKA